MKNAFLTRLQTALTLFLLSLPATLPILRFPLICGDDIGFHALRVAQTSALWRQGIWFTRWMPDMAYGFGYPLFNYYAPLPAYLASAIGLVTGAHLGLRLTFAGILLVGGMGVYGWLRTYFSKTSAIVAAVAYMYAPYFGYNVYFRGNLGESMGMALLPFAMWGIAQWGRNGGAKWLMLGVFSYAGIQLSHNIYALSITPLLISYTLFEAWQSDKRRMAVGRVAWAGILAVGLTAVFWMPALLERDYIQTSNYGPHFQYYNNFVTVKEIFSLPVPNFDNVVNPSPARTLGLVGALLGFLAFFFTKGTRDQKRHIWFFAGGVAVYLFLLTASSQPIWDTVPLMSLFQFPWRMLGIAALCLAVIIAGTAEWIHYATYLPVGAGQTGNTPQLTNGLPTRLSRPSANQKTFTGRARWGGEEVLSLSRFVPAPSRPYVHAVLRILPFVFMVLLMATSKQWFAPRYCHSLDDLSVASIAPYELGTGLIGGTSANEFLPRTVDQLPPAPAATPFSLPDFATISQVDLQPLLFSATVASPNPFTLTRNVFDFPGWQAWVDGVAVPIVPSESYGLIGVKMPAGEHTIRIEWGSTPLRTGAFWVSVVSLLTLGITIFPVMNHGTKMDRPMNGAEKAPFMGRKILGQGFIPVIFNGTIWLVFSVITAATFTWILPQFNTPYQQTFTPKDVPIPRPITYPDGVQLLGYGATNVGDQTWQIDLYWQAEQTPTRPYQSIVSLVDSTGLSWSEPDTTRPAGFRPAIDSRQWAAGQVAVDSQILTAMAGTPPGTYTVQVTLFDKETLQSVGPPNRVLFPLTLLRPQQLPAFDRTNAVYLEELALLDVQIDRYEARSGDPIQLTFLWESVQKPTQHWQLCLMLGQGEQIVWETRAPLVRSGFPTTAWQAGDVWRGRWVGRVPAFLPTDSYQWTMQLCNDQANDSEQVVLGDLAITAPERVFEMPAFTHPTTAKIEGVAELVGLTRGEGTVTLVWRSLKGTETSYRIFVHVLDENGDIVAQADGEPAGWTRPTTGWVSGEFVVDEVVLEMPALATSLAIGMYDPATGDRLPVTEDGVLLPDGRFVWRVE